MKAPLQLFTKDGRPVYRTGFESYTLKPKRGFHPLAQVSTLLPPDSPRNRVRLKRIKKQTGADCEWREAA